MNRRIFHLLQVRILLHMTQELRKLGINYLNVVSNLSVLPVKI